MIRKHSSQSTPSNSAERLFTSLVEPVAASRDEVQQLDTGRTRLQLNAYLSLGLGWPPVVIILFHSNWKYLEAKYVRHSNRDKTAEISTSSSIFGHIRERFAEKTTPNGIAFLVLKSSFDAVQLFYDVSEVPGGHVVQCLEGLEINGACYSGEDGIATERANEAELRRGEEINRKVLILS
ncbi:hypothetical protein C8R44DRAFT_751658 [Mycena epipterygia]|nr:hypothetical protein C8R44DRAFT_751658 [Mycena epipterygia]